MLNNCGKAPKIKESSETVEIVEKIKFVKKM
jgi:hypothetical protein